MKELLLKILDLITSFFKNESQKQVVPLPKPSKKPGEGRSWADFIAYMKESTISDPMRVAIVAQGILESGRGTTKLAQDHCNFHGMKYRHELAGYATPVKYQAHDGEDVYCAFQNVALEVQGYLKFISRSPYKGWEDRSMDTMLYIEFIKSRGYAEDPNYVAKIRKLLPEAMELLGIDSRPSMPPPDELPEPEISGPLPQFPGEEIGADPVFVKIKGISFNEKGNYQTKTGKFLGLVVHYTVSGRKASNARGVVNWLDQSGYGCMTMDENGIIYVPEDFDIFADVAYHAGTSKWRGMSGVSTYFAGMEICCWGRNSKEGPYRESKGEANIIAGRYQQYTRKQEIALINFILYALKKNPHFEISNICGHDEIRAEAGKRGDKQDPGASLSMTMPQFRKLIEKEAKRLGIR